MAAGAADVWLNFLHLFGCEPLDSEPVVEASLKQAVQKRKFRGFGGDDHFSADFVFDAVLAAKLEPLSGCLARRTWISDFRLVINP